MTTADTINEVGKHLQDLKLPGIMAILPPGDSRIPEKGREKHPDKSLLKFTTDLGDTVGETNVRNLLQQRLPALVVTNYGVFFKENGKVKTPAAEKVTLDATEAAHALEAAQPNNGLSRPYAIRTKRLVQQIGTSQEREKAEAELEGWRDLGWIVVNDHVFGSDANGQQPKLWHILYLEKYVEADPQPQPQPAVEKVIEPPTVHVPDAIIEPDEKPDTSDEPLEKVVTQARRGAAALYRAEVNRRIQMAINAGVDIADAYTARQRPSLFPSVPVLGKVNQHVGAS